MRPSGYPLRYSASVRRPQDLCSARRRGVIESERSLSQMKPSWKGLLLLSLLGACERSPLNGKPAVAGGGSSGGTSTIGGASGGSSGSGSGLPVARIGDDGFCGATTCPQGQQCCLSTGNCVAPSRVASDCPEPTPKPAICGGATCPAGQTCCLLDGTCIDPATAGTSCPKPSVASNGGSLPSTTSNGGSLPSAPSSGDSLPCASNADCRPTQFCQKSPLSRGCLGPGTCQSRSNCGFSWGTPGYCGCDGVTYSDIQSACRAGVRIIADFACGTPVNPDVMPGSPRAPVIYCGTSDQCPQGQQCCSITGRCYDPSVPYLCKLPPPGTSISCVDDSQCTNVEFCSGSGCSGPGGCAGFSAAACGGELKPVCGCDGKSYTNAGCAVAARVRTAHDGICGGADSGP